MANTDKLSYFTVNFKGTHAIVEVLVKRGGLKKKVDPSPPLYKVQVGAFFQLENAKKLQKELEEKGYHTYIVKA